MTRILSPGRAWSATAEGAPRGTAPSAPVSLLSPNLQPNLRARNPGQLTHVNGKRMFSDHKINRLLTSPPRNCYPPGFTDSGEVPDHGAAAAFAQFL